MTKNIDLCRVCQAAPISAWMPKIDRNAPTTCDECRIALRVKAKANKAAKSARLREKMLAAGAK